MKITRIRYYHVGNTRPIFNQTSHVVVVDTDQGIQGIGEGGHKDSIDQLARLVIGENPLATEHLWQLMYRHFFYPPGREKVHAQGAVDLALWDIKGKAFDVPVWKLLGGPTRNHVECYSTGFPSAGSLRDKAQACIEAGFRAFRYGTSGPNSSGGAFNAHVAVNETFEACQQIREGVGPSGDWAIDFHTRFDLSDAIRLAGLIEPLAPYFVEDLIRSENPGVYRDVRQKVNVPIAVGEHYGDRWDANELIENRWMDYSRISIPNCGGITEYLKIAALCETHYVGLIPHFTGPIATAALVHCIAALPHPAMMEMRRDGNLPEPHLNEKYDFRNGKVWPNDRPGLGVDFDPTQAELVLDINEQDRPITLYRRPDGSITNW